MFFRVLFSQFVPKDDTATTVTRHVGPVSTGSLAAKLTVPVGVAVYWGNNHHTAKQVVILQDKKNRLAVFLHRIQGEYETASEILL